MFAYGGWQNSCYVAEEIRDPERNLPRAILIGVAIVIAVYLGANVAYLHVLRRPALAATRTPAADSRRPSSGSAAPAP
jgi:APA family basic amino acid/polyamine antiporter